MRNRILASFPNSVFQNHSDSNIFIADFTKRTESVRHVEVHAIQPQCPKNNANLMDCFKIMNPSNHDIEFNVFDDNQFKDAQGNDLRHCECCIFPSENHDKSWVVMLEIKDCKPRNISNYKDDVIEQIISTTNIFRQKNIITTHKVYGIVAIPRCKVSFNNTIFGMPPDYMSLKKQHKILFAAGNVIQITDNSTMKCYE